MGQSYSSEPPKAVGAVGDKKPKVGKSGKKICCACPDTKKARDDCVIQKGEEDSECLRLIELHKECLRADGFTVK